MTTVTNTPNDVDALGVQTGRLTPGTRSSLRTGMIAVALLVPAAVLLTTQHRPWAATLLALVLSGLGLMFASVAAIELLPTPGRLVFHEHGFADIRRDHTTDLYLDGTSVVHTVPSENLPQSARAIRTAPTSSVATR